MKLFSAALLLAVLPACSASARADTFTFTPTSGTAFTFTTGATPDFSLVTGNYNYARYNTPFGMVYFFADSQDKAFQAQYPYGHFDFRLDTATAGYIVDGPTLFTGDGNNPSFIPGTYTLTADPFTGNNMGGVLVVDNGVAVTPEPSSFALLGTGVLGVAGVLRRRLAA